LKVYIGPFDHWFKPARWLHTFICWWCGFDHTKWHIVEHRKIKAGDEYDKLNCWIKDSFLYKWLLVIENWFNRRDRKISIHIDKYDVWNLGDTVAMIALPLMYEFKRQGINGAPAVDDEDVPAYLRSTVAPALTQLEKQTGGVDKLWHQRWNWVVDEIIWSLEQVNDRDSESQFHSDVDPDKPRDEPGISFEESMRRGKYDSAGHEAHLARRQNGLRLFGKYLEALWN